MESSPIIRMRDVHKGFNGQVVLDGVDLDIPRRRTTVVIGPSGCGKSVLLKHMIGLLQPDRGRVWFDGVDISAASEGDLGAVRRRIGFLFQGSALFDSMTVAGNVSFPLTEHGIGTERERRARCREMLNLVGLGDAGDKFPEELSGGQKKRVALARAIILQPDAILYDEPTTGLDPIRADLINELILKVRSALGNTAVVVTHDMSSARKVGDRIVMLHEGRLIADTTPEALPDVDNDVVARFIAGIASPDELESIRGEGAFVLRAQETDASVQNP